MLRRCGCYLGLLKSLLSSTDPQDEVRVENLKELVSGIDGV